MTAAELDRIGTRSTGANLSQATAVEQARAVAEVQAAVYVAQANPRDVDRAVAEMHDVCGRMVLAQVAFYTVPNRGHDKSVHLARELIRIWGNTDYGVRELRRDDTVGESEVLAFAWDQQTNSRSSRSFINPHARMKKVDGRQVRVALDDLHDIYLSNQNIGARAVRECIFTILPRWFAEQAADVCRATLEHGEGRPLADRVRDLVAVFGRLGVDVQRLESKVGRKRGQWTAGDVADFRVAYTSVTRDGISVDELFPAVRVTAAEIARQAPAAPEESPTEDDRPRSEEQHRKLFALLGDNGLSSEEMRPQRLAWMSDVLGREVTTSKTLTVAEVSRLIDALDPQPDDEPPQDGE
jgi:hypothetical protein